VRGILIITEDVSGLTPAQSSLVREGYNVILASPDEDSVLAAAVKMTPEVVLVDSRRKREQAAESRRLLRTECNLKELLIIALLTSEQALNMEWAGIDEFILAPCGPDELVARMRLLLWRTKSIKSDQIIKIGSLLIDMMNYDVEVDGVPVELTFKEYELLRFLATHRGRVFTRESLLDHVWGYDYYGGTRTVDVHIRRLRAKLAPACDTMIETVRNVGYRFST
jgi:DNA-binding response OmpR family regulator